MEEDLILKVHRLSELNDDTKSHFPQSMRDNKKMHKRIWGWGLKYNGEIGKTTRHTGKPWGGLNHVVDADWIGYPMECGEKEVKLQHVRTKIGENKYQTIYGLFV